MQDQLISILQKHRDYALVMDKYLLNRACKLNLSHSNKDLAQLDYLSPAILNHYIFSFIKSRQLLSGVGGYAENRIIYQSKSNFEGFEARSVHLGIDIWAPDFSAIYAPLNGKIHSFADNASFGDYGPTIIIEHQLNGCIFFTLYGHLSRQSLIGLKEEQYVTKGQKIAELGPYEENGNWPPHLHFQIIKSLDGLRGDYPGVAAPSQKERYLHNCPDPNLILRIPCLNEVKV